MIGDRPVQIDHVGTRELLKSSDIQDFIMQVAEVAAPEPRYRAKRYDELIGRTAVNITDDTPGALSHEIRTGRLAKIATTKVEI